MTFDPTSVEVACVTLPKDYCVQVPWKYIKVCGYSDLFCKNLKQRSLTPRWPLTPHLLRSHVWLYPRIIVSKSHENTSKYVDTVNLFAKTWTKGHWPLDDLWPHICWGHRCDSTQGSLCPSPMGIHQCMWIQWSILQKLPHTYTYIHTHAYRPVGRGAAWRRSPHQNSAGREREKEEKGEKEREKRGKKKEKRKKGKEERNGEECKRVNTPLELSKHY